MSFSSFISMSGYGEFVWGAYGFTLLVLAVNIGSAIRRLRKAKRLKASIDQGQ